MIRPFCSNLKGDVISRCFTLIQQLNAAIINLAFCQDNLIKLGRSSTTNTIKIFEFKYRLYTRDLFCQLYLYSCNQLAFVGINRIFFAGNNRNQAKK